jgi:hypothetical protein
MPDSREVLARLRAFRSKFESLLASARKKAARGRVAPAREPTRLRELTGFGANPGNLRMFSYAPEDLPPNAPLVIALHGCTQTADEYDHGTGWSSLADRLGFAVVYPQQQPANNPKNCFSWFLPGDIARGHGEALSIREMVEHAIATHWLMAEGVLDPKNPMIDSFAGCCALAASGHATAAPPSSVMNARRFIRSPRRRGRAQLQEYRARALSQS